LVKDPTDASVIVLEELVVLDWVDSEVPKVDAYVVLAFIWEPDIGVG